MCFITFLFFRMTRETRTWNGMATAILQPGLIQMAGAIAKSWIRSRSKLSNGKMRNCRKRSCSITQTTDTTTTIKAKERLLVIESVPLFFIEEDYNALQFMGICPVISSGFRPKWSAIFRTRLADGSLFPSS